jgi:Cof subfamily protein (haloacid dehalogenase superfamily)
MIPQLIAVDLDGTLVDQQLQLDPRDVEAAKLARSKGIRVIVATGRMFESALPFVNALGIDGPLVCYQGALVKDLDGTLLHFAPLSSEVANKLLDYARDQYLTLIAYNNGDIVVERMDEGARIYAATARREPKVIQDLRPLMANGVPKLVIVADQIRIERELEILSKMFSGKADFVISQPRFLEITAAGINKKYGLEYVAKRLGINRENVVALGDSYNDLEMIRWAGIGASVANAPAEVKAEADIVVTSVGNAPLACLLKELGVA